MTKKHLFPFFMGLLIVVGFLFPFEVTAQSGTVNYSVRAILPSNQVSNNSYFDLLVEPGQNQELEVEIYNNAQEDITVRPSVHNASTNRNGLVVYEEQEELDPSLKIPLTDILTVEEEEVTVPAGDSVILSAQLEMPEEEFDGIILGGMRFEKDRGEDETTEGVNIQNNYSYVIGVQLTENDNAVDPELHLNTISPELVNHRTAIVANLQNSVPTLIENLTIDARVFKEGEEEPLKEVTQEQVNMAPNSNMDFTIDWENRAINPGNYILEMKVEHSSDTWEWEEPFTIEESDAENLNENAVELDENQPNYWLIIGVILLVIMVICLLLYILKLKKSQNN